MSAIFRFRGPPLRSRLASPSPESQGSYHPLFLSIDLAVFYRVLMASRPSNEFTLFPRKTWPRGGGQSLAQFLRILGKANEAAHHCPTLGAINPSMLIKTSIPILRLRMHLLYRRVDDEVQEDVVASQCADDLAPALDVDGDALVEETLQFWLCDFRHLSKLIETRELILS